MGNLQVTKIPPQVGRGTPSTPLVTITRVIVPHANFKQTSGILQMMSCNSSWRISAGRLLSESWMHPPGTHYQHLGGIQWGNGDPNVDDLGGHLSERGRVGTCRTTTSTPCFQTTRWRVGTQRTTSSPPAPTQPDEDVGCLINTLATGLQLGTPHINTFQQQSHTRQNGSVFWTMVPQGTVCKRPLPRVIGQRGVSILSLKGAVADMARYTGPTTSIAHILQKLTVIFGIVALFDVLMQNFYKVTQSNHEKVPSFAMRLEGTLNQIQCSALEESWTERYNSTSKHCLFHGVCKHIRDSIQYLYSNPRTTYSQLMIAACKVMSENEEAWDKVRSRSAVTTEPVKGTTKLGNQIARLMAVLTRARQGNSPGTTPNSPRHRGHGRGWMDRNTPICPNSHNGWTGLGQPAVYLLVMAQGLQVKAREMPKGPKIPREALQIRGTPVPSSASGTKVGATWLGNVPPPGKTLNQAGWNQGNVAQPPAGTNHNSQQ